MSLDVATTATVPTADAECTTPSLDGVHIDTSHPALAAGTLADTSSAESRQMQQLRVELFDAARREKELSHKLFQQHRLIDKVFDGQSSPDAMRRNLAPLLAHEAELVAARADCCARVKRGHDEIRRLGRTYYASLVCDVCFQGDVDLSCQGCQRGFHRTCKKVERMRSESWYCDECRYCRSCFKIVPGDGPTCRWRLGFTHCSDCGNKISMQLCCTICEKPYSRTRMVECSRCEKWIHLACDPARLNSELYIAFLACADCRTSRCTTHVYTCAVCDPDAPGAAAVASLRKPSNSPLCSTSLAVAGASGTPGAAASASGKNGATMPMSPSSTSGKGDFMSWDQLIAADVPRAIQYMQPASGGASARSPRSVGSITSPRKRRRGGRASSPRAAPSPSSSGTPEPVVRAARLVAPPPPSAVSASAAAAAAGGGGANLVVPRSPSVVRRYNDSTLRKLEEDAKHALASGLSPSARRGGPRSPWDSPSKRRRAAAASSSLHTGQHAAASGASSGAPTGASTATATTTATTSTSAATAASAETTSTTRGADVATGNSNGGGDGATNTSSLPHDPDCFICYNAVASAGTRDAVLRCGFGTCTKAYHAACVAAFAKLPIPTEPGSQWTCPWHTCHTGTCSRSDDSLFQCSTCPTSYCPAHMPSNNLLLGGRSMLCTHCLALYQNEQRGAIHVPHPSAVLTPGTQTVLPMTSAGAAAAAAASAVAPLDHPVVVWRGSLDLISQDSPDAHTRHTFPVEASFAMPQVPVPLVLPKALSVMHVSPLHFALGVHPLLAFRTNESGKPIFAEFLAYLEQRRCSAVVVLDDQAELHLIPSGLLTHLPPFRNEDSVLVAFLVSYNTGTGEQQATWLRSQVPASVSKPPTQLVYPVADGPEPGPAHQASNPAAGS